jgi:hypothetical protein
MSSFNRFILILLFASGAAWSDGNYLKIKNAKCPVKQYSTGANQFVATKKKLNFFGKMKIVGKKFAQNPSITVFLVDGDAAGQMFAVGTTCVTLGPEYVAPSEAKSKPAIPLEERVGHRLRMNDTGLGTTSSTYMILGFQTWQEEISISNSATDEVLPALVTTMGLCPGFGFHLKRSASYQISWDSCFLYGISNLGLKTAGIPAYSAANVQYWGVITGPAFIYSWSPTLAAGLEFPVAYRHGLWPDPPQANWTANKKSAFFPMYLISTHWRGERWGFVQKIGLMKTWPGYYWSLQVNRNF